MAKAKRLTSTDVLIVCGLLFTMAVGVGSFFGGMYLGKKQTEAHFRGLVLDLASEQQADDIAYHQKHLTSFYHNVWVPMHEFHGAWFNTFYRTATKKDFFNQFASLADRVTLLSLEIKKTSFSARSPLLTDAKNDYIRSLNAFAEQLPELDLSVPRPWDLYDDPLLREAIEYVLRAQFYGYESIRQWNIIKNKAIDDQGVLKKDDMSLSAWRSLSIHTKNAYIAKTMWSQRWFAPYWPHDVVARIDKLDVLGSFTGKSQTIQSIIEQLRKTEAVRPGDFTAERNLYSKEKLPLIPFFYGP